MATSRENSKCSLTGKHVFMPFRRIYILHSENTECLTHFEKNKWRLHFSFEITVFMTKNMARIILASCPVLAASRKRSQPPCNKKDKTTTKMLYLKSPLFFSFFLSFVIIFTRRQKGKKKIMMKLKRTNLMNNWTLKRKSHPLKCLLIASSIYGWITFNWCVTSGYQTHERRQKIFQKQSKLLAWII